MFSFKVSFVVLLAAVLGLTAAEDDVDHSKHCHIDGFPSIHIDIGDSFVLPGACLKMLCKQNDLFEVIGTCNQPIDSAENLDFAKKLVGGEKCPK